GLRIRQHQPPVRAVWLARSNRRAKADHPLSPAFVSAGLLLRDELERTLEGGVLGLASLGQRDIGLADLDVGAVATVEDVDRIAACRVGAELPQHVLALAPPGLGLGEQLDGLVERDREDLALALEAAVLL